MSENIIEKNMEYKSKYLKYKLKYLELKKQSIESVYGYVGGGIMDSITNMGFNMYLDFLPPNQRAIFNKFQRKDLLIKLLKSSLSHGLDTQFYTNYLVPFIKYVTILVSSEVSPVNAIVAARGLYSILNNMKHDLKYYQDFINLREFMLANEALFKNIVKQYNMPQLSDLFYDIFVKLIYINPQQQMMS